jgi:nitrate/nitrite-specific signal transduction histidine kinase
MVKIVKPSLSIKLAILIVGIGVLLLLVSSYMNYTSQTALHKQMYIDKAKSVAYALDASIKNIDDLKQSNITGTIEKHIWLNSDILNIRVNIPDSKGTLRTISSNVFNDIQTEPDSENVNAYTKDIIIQKTPSSKSTSILRVITPIHISGKTIGTYQIDLTLEYMQKQLLQNMVSSAFVMALLVFCTIFFFMLALNRMILQPIGSINQGIQEIAKGNLEHQIHIHSNDEFERVAETFNTMTSDLKQSRKSIEDYGKNLEVQIAERTQELNKKLTEIEEMNKLMVGRELRMAELKKELDTFKNGTHT